MQCPKCKARASDGARFCPKCGMPLTVDATARSATTRNATTRNATTRNATTRNASSASPAPTLSARQRASASCQQPGQRMAAVPAAPYPYVQAPIPVLTARHHARAVLETDFGTKAVRFALAASDVLLMVLVSFIPWFSLEGGLARFVEYTLSVPSSWSFPALGYRTITFLAPAVRDARQLYAALVGSWVFPYDLLLMGAGVILMALWVFNMVALGMAMTADAAGRRATIVCPTLGIATCIIVWGVLFMMSWALVSGVGGSYGLFDALSLALGAACPGLWLSLFAFVAKLFVQLVSPH